ncbi:MAG: LamG domain-containing protein [Fibrobacteres bacterium]|jgi:hypothetical protein|nr:LamG domain-containing protein [Fibrobacterota bacterium]
MKAVLLSLAPLLFMGCLPGVNDVVLSARVRPFQDNSHPKPNPKPVKDPVSPFALDSGTVFLADFDCTLVNRVTEAQGSMQAGAFVPALFGSGVHLQADAGQKFLVAFPNTPALSLRSGTLEALVRYDAVQPGFSHFIDKSWQYGVSAFDGKLAAWFGSTWWYTDVALPVGEWSYVAVTFDGQTLKMYLNGGLAASTAYSGTGNPEYSSVFDLGIGNADDAGFNIPFKGTVDAVRLSRPVRTADQIAEAWTRIEPRNY